MIKYSYFKIIKHVLGNFKETCLMVAKFDEIFVNHFHSKTNYISWLGQNTIIDVRAKKMNDIICNEIKECGVFSVMVDEARLTFNLLIVYIP